MSGSVHRFPASPVRTAFRESVRLLRAEAARTLRRRLDDAEDQLADLWCRTMDREDQGLDAADAAMCDEIRRIGGDLMAAADEYQGRS